MMGICDVCSSECWFAYGYVCVYGYGYGGLCTYGCVGVNGAVGDGVCSTERCVGVCSGVCVGVLDSNEEALPGVLVGVLLSRVACEGECGGVRGPAPRPPRCLERRELYQHNCKYHYPLKRSS